MKLELGISCHHYEHRLCWMLSSLLAQKGILPEFTISVAYIEGTGNPTCKAVLDHFEMITRRYRADNPDQLANWPTIKRFPYPDKERFQRRGLVRNDMLVKSDADWIWFADCDMVVHPDFLARAEELFSGELKDETRMCTTGRFSTILEPTEELIEMYDYPVMILDPQSVVQGMEMKKKANIGAGFCQIFNVEHIREHHNGEYVDPANPRDNLWSKFWKTRSDTVLRRKCGKRKIDLPWFCHLQHPRDNEYGHHIEVQR